MCKLETTAGAIEREDEDLVTNMLPGMVDKDNQPLPENIPTAGEENEGNNTQFFSEWEHSGSCYCYLEEGCKNKARINFNTDVKPTIQQLFEIFFSNHLLLEQSSHRQTNSYKKKNIAQSCMVSFSIGLVCGFLWPQ